MPTSDDDLEPLPLNTLGEILREVYSMDHEELRQNVRRYDREARRCGGVPTPTTKPHIRLKR